jgi:hypothetical protein
MLRMFALNVARQQRVWFAEVGSTTPRTGARIRASLKLRRPDILEVKGCLLIVCDTQVWRRVESLCGAPAASHGLNASTDTLLTPNFLLAPRALSEMN